MMTIDDDDSFDLWNLIEVNRDCCIVALPDLKPFSFKYEYLDLFLDNPNLLEQYCENQEQLDFWTEFLPILDDIIEQKYNLYLDMGFIV